ILHFIFEGMFMKIKRFLSVIISLAILSLSLCVGSFGADAGSRPEFRLVCQSSGTNAAVTVELAAGSFNSLDFEFEMSDSVACVNIKRSSALKNFCTENEDTLFAANTEVAGAAFASFNSFNSAGAVFEVTFKVPENAVSTVKLKILTCAVSTDEKVTEVAPVLLNNTVTIDTRHVHSYTASERVEPTCTKEGYVKYSCSCGDFYVEKLSVKDHSYGEWKTVRPATTSAPGEEKCTCSGCGSSKTREIPQLRRLSVKLSDMKVYCNDKNTASPDITNPDNIGYTVKYESSNEKILKIDNDGTFTTLKRGTAQIKCIVTDEFGDVYEAQCTVKVNFKAWQWIVYIFAFGWLWNR
ncbi:MAG: hypothetical protein IJU45_06865, partial [Clostridia bacterium]|nr:hypothetical protein [Clostridia bacterium]